MLKLKLFSIAAIAMLAFTACGSNSQKADAASALESAGVDVSSINDAANEMASSLANDAANIASSAAEAATKGN